MITEQEERVIILIKNAIVFGINYYQYKFTEEQTIKQILETSEIALHLEAVEQLVEWLKQSEL